MADNLVLDADDDDERTLDLCSARLTLTQAELDVGRELGQRVSPGAPSGLRLSAEQDRARTKASALAKVMLAHGVPEVSIELQAGRPSSFGEWDALAPVTEMSHHTVSRLSNDLTPVLGLCKRGRSDVPGPLCNGYGGYDLCYRILTFGWANHPGAGGPMTVPLRSGGTATIPRDSARRYAWGTEWEGGLASSDWSCTLANPRTGDRMTMREFMGRSNAAIRAYFELEHHCEHSTWTTRKIDRLGYTARAGTAELQHYTQEEDMPLSDDDVTRIADAVWDKLLNPPGARFDVRAAVALGQVYNRVVPEEEEQPS